MAIVHKDRRSEEQATDLTSLSDVARTYFGHSSPHIILTGLTIALIVRLVVGSYGLADLVVLAVTISMVGVVEWFIHLFLLHAPSDSLRMKKFKTGAGHREHHLDPANVGWLMLAPADASVFLLMLLAWNLTWPLLIGWVLGASLLSTYLTAVTASYFMLAHYEWTHLLVHTRYQPKLGYYKRLVSHHRLHHYRNEHHWLGVTSRVGDKALGTLPKSKSDVPLSDTARTL